LPPAPRRIERHDRALADVQRDDDEVVGEGIVAPWRGSAQVTRGRAIVEQGDEDRGFAEIREGLDVLRRTEMRLGDSLLFPLFAETIRFVTRTPQSGPTDFVGP
jgi:hypothetical protein